MVYIVSIARAVHVENRTQRIYIYSMCSAYLLEVAQREVD